MKARPVKYKYRLKLTSKVDDLLSPNIYGCNFRCIENGFEVEYNDLSTNTHNIIRVGNNGLEGGNRAEIDRSGDYAGLIVVEPGRTTTSCYKTVHGSIDINVKGINVEYVLGDDTATAVIEYEFGTDDNLMHAKQMLLVERA